MPDDHGYHLLPSGAGGQLLPQKQLERGTLVKKKNNAGDPDPHDPHVLGLPDPDPLVRGTDPDPDLSLVLSALK
jgi:hypothetical protein